MKVKRTRTMLAVAGSVFIMYLAVLFITIGSEASDHRVAIEKDGQNIYKQPLKNPSMQPKIDSEYDDEIKNIELMVEDIAIPGLDNGRLFPKTPVDFIVYTSGPTPNIVTIYPDRDTDFLNVSYDLSTGEVLVSSDMSGMIHVDKENTSANYNISIKRWEVCFRMSFDWSYGKDISYSVMASALDEYGNDVSLIIEEAYIFESDVVFSGEPSFSVSDPDSMSPEGYLKGGVFLKVQSLSLIFEGSSGTSPDPADVRLGITDDLGHVWEYRPTKREQLKDIVFSIPMPDHDGPIGLSFEIFEIPYGGEPLNDVTFSFYIDSTSPAVGDFRYLDEDRIIRFSFKHMENGAGIDTESVSYSIKKRGHSGSNEWAHPRDLVISDDRLTFTIEYPGEGDFDISLRLEDKVSNKASFMNSFFFSTVEKPIHSIRLKDFHVLEDQIIINDEVEMTIVVENLGTQHESDLDLDVRIDHKIINVIEIDSIPAGSSREYRWNWKAEEGTHLIRMELDPQMKVDESNHDDNIIESELYPEYRDILIDDNYIGISNPEASNSEVVDLTFMVKSVGSIESGPIKVLFKQDERYLGIYQVPSIQPDHSCELIITWKVDTTDSNLILHLDPYNEVVETIENNNIAEFLNPFYTEQEQTPDIADEKQESEEEGSPDNSSATTDPTPSEGGGTIWNGPERDNEDDTGTHPATPDFEPPQESGPDSIPMTIPVVGIVLTTIFVCSAYIGLRSEIARFRGLSLLLPLYSKLKKSKIEKGVRFEILGYLKAKPGANYTELKRNLDLNDGSLVHHLRILEREELIYSKKMGKYKLFYVSSYRRQPAVDEYLSPFHKRILDIINSNPGIVPKKISKILDRSQTDISYHLMELSRNGFLERKKKGRHTHYYLRSEYVNLMEA